MRCAGADAVGALYVHRSVLAPSVCSDCRLPALVSGAPCVHTSHAHKGALKAFGIRGPPGIYIDQQAGGKRGGEMGACMLMMALLIWVLLPSQKAC